MRIWHALIFLTAVSCTQSEIVTFVSDWEDRGIRCENNLDWKPVYGAAMPELKSYGDLSFVGDSEFDPHSAKIVHKSKDVTVLFVTREPNISPQPDLPTGPEPPDIDTPEFIAWHDSIQKCISGISRLYLLPSNNFLEIPVTAHCGNYWDSPDSIRFVVYNVNGIAFVQLGWSSPAAGQFRLIRVNPRELVNVASSTC